MKSPSSTSSFCFRFALGLVCAFLLGLCLCGMVTLHEDMAVSNSPMVMGAPFIMVAFIFAFSWLSYAFFGAATSCERRAEGRLPVRWGWPALWFALAVSGLSGLYFLCTFSLSRPAASEYVGLAVWL